MTTTTASRSTNVNIGQPQRLNQPATTDMVSPAIEREEISLGLTGKWIKVEADRQAVVVLGNGRTRILGRGRHFIKPQLPGKCEVYYIDVSQQKALVQVTTTTADNWEVRIDLEVWWHVSDPARIIRAPRPARSIQVAGREALRDLIQSLPHDRLIAGCGVKALDSRGITETVKQRLIGIPAVAIEEVKFLDRSGDAWRMDALRRANLETARCQLELAIETRQNELQQARLAQHAAVEAARCQQQLAIETRQNELQQARLAQTADVEAARYRKELAVETSQNEFRQARNVQRVGLLDSEQEVSVKEARVAWQREQELMHGRVEKAKLAAEEGRHNQKKEFLDIQSNNLRIIPEREYALAMEALKQKSQVMSGATQAFTTLAASQGVLVNQDASLRSLMDGLEAMSKELAYTPHYEHILGCEDKNPAADGVPGSNGRGVKGNGTYPRPIPN